MARILIVEDVPDFRLMMREILNTAGHEVAEAGNGHDAMRQMEAGRFDLLVTDVVMPESDGVELIRSLAKQGRRLPILAVSGGGHNLPAAVSLALTEAAGAHRTLFKPFRAAELLSAVDALLAAK
ncbi:MAG: response regulator [Alphaproteobacteria bacterium]|nr:MAG: response regulator [Alphaproteobacteria bacterium]